MKLQWLIAIFLVCTAPSGLNAADAALEGKAVYEKSCAPCHATGTGGAPKLGDSEEWKARIGRGAEALFFSAFRGKNAMPPRGGDAMLTYVEVEAAVIYLVSQSTGIPAAKVATLQPVPEAARAVAPVSGSTAQKPGDSAQESSTAARASSANAATSEGDSAKGKAIYESTCSACHAAGVAGAPRLSDAAAWAPRIKAGMRALYDSALKGKNTMPPKGGNLSLADADVTAAVGYMVSRIQSSASGPTESTKPDSVAKSEVSTEAKAQPMAPTSSPGPKGKAVYQATCAACHAAGLAGAPKLGDTAAWEPRIKNGKATLYVSALKGKNAMPPKGGNVALADADVKAAVDYILAQAKGAGSQRSPAATATPTAPATAGEDVPGAEKGRATYQATCAACHGAGLAGAPKLGDVKAWEQRSSGGVGGLYQSALKGKNAMPAKGGNATLGEADVRAAVDFMLAQLDAPGKKADAEGARAQGLQGNASAAPRAAEGAAKSSDTTGTGAQQPPPAPSEGPGVAPASALGGSPRAGAQASAQTPPAAQSTQIAGAAADPNAFNRLLRPVGKRNLPAAESGIHDPANDGTHMLQPPLVAFGGLPKSNAGNQVDWVKALNEGKINPRMDKVDSAVEPLVLDMNIVREVKGSMPDVVYPHKQHTQWLDCSNCHPAIFVPQKGANQISMAAILLGQKCGVCHGKVAFPVSECRLCHSKNKETKVGETNQ